MLQIEKTCKEIQKKNRVRIRGIRKSSFVRRLWCEDGDIER